jgi:hypothetical protein
MNTPAADDTGTEEEEEETDVMASFSIERNAVDALTMCIAIIILV